MLMRYLLHVTPLAYEQAQSLGCKAARVTMHEDGSSPKLPAVFPFGGNVSDVLPFDWVVLTNPMTICAMYALRGV